MRLFPHLSCLGVYISSCAIRKSLLAHLCTLGSPSLKVFPGEELCLLRLFPGARLPQPHQGWQPQAGTGTGRGVSDLIPTPRTLGLWRPPGSIVLSAQGSWSALEFHYWGALGKVAMVQGCVTAANTVLTMCCICWENPEKPVGVEGLELLYPPWCHHLRL